MKKFFSNPAVALLIAVLVVCSSVLLNTRIKFGSRCEAVSDRFYNTLSGEASIADSLRSFCATAEKLVLIGEQYDIDAAEDAGDSIGSIMSALREESHDIGAIYDDYDRLLKEVFTLESALARENLSESDAATYASLQHDAADAKAAIDQSTYNDVVRSFQKQYRRFPTPQLAALSGVVYPALFD